jgi:hypothetical protein
MPIEFKDALRELETHTPCREAPDSWQHPKSKREVQKAREACIQRCPIVDACRTLGEDTEATGMFGGVYLVDGKVAKRAPGRKSTWFKKPVN